MGSSLILEYLKNWNHWCFKNSKNRVTLVFTSVWVILGFYKDPLVLVLNNKLEWFLVLGLGYLKKNKKNSF
jgi:hypothetical protein